MAKPERSAERSSAAPAIDVRGLEAALRERVRGEVRFDDGSRALYATDASNYRQPPVGVVLPRDKQDVVQAVAACREYGAPMLARGAGTSLAGQCCNAAVVLDCSKYMNRVLAIDTARKVARVQPGVVLDDLRDAAEQCHLTFGPDPATHNRCTLGGMIGNNSCGVHSVMAGKTSDNVEELEILTYDGERMTVGATSEEELARIVAQGGRRGAIYAALVALRDRYAQQIRERFPAIPRRVSGYNLDALLPEAGFHVARALVGSENTCVTILEATLRLVDSPPARTLLVLGYPDAFVAADHVPEIMAYRPVGLEGFDDRLVQAVRDKGDRERVAGLELLPQGGGMLMVEFGGDTLDAANAKAAELMEALGKASNPPSVKLVADPHQAHLIWLVRESGLGASARIPGHRDTWPGWEDSAVAPEVLGGYLRELRALTDRYGYYNSLYGHFGQGCVHTRIDFDLVTAAGVRQFVAFMHEAADLVVRYGGSLSGEHGDGQARAALLPKMFGPELVEAFREFKAIWDPDWKMNPAKVVDPYDIVQNLRLGEDYAPTQPTTHFQFPHDDGSFARATLRCVGVGLCRRHEGGTMCPSYMATREESDSTRGRTHLLFEMLQGNVIRDGWRSQAVRKSLDLCLACKGCKHDCPVNVDVATYKSEFLSHYYAGRLRPRTAYSMGLIYWWARLASHAPRLVNAVAHTPVLGTLAKAVGGIAPEREIPRFAPQTFRQWFAAREPRRPHTMGRMGQSQVLLWPDTFNNHFHPETVIAAVETLEAANFEVVLPGRSLCCGRPLYDWGMLGTAKRLLWQVLDTLRPQIESGVPVVGLEPSCVSVFRDELVNLFPNDPDAQRLRGQTYLLGDFLAQNAPDFAPPKLARKAVVHGHCHHKAVLGMDGEEAMLRRLGLDYSVLDDGCCGMAGAFGFERGEHYDVSLKCGERALLPAVRAAATDTLIVSDGFSCREQIAQTTPRRALHLAEVIALALRGEGEASPGLYPEAAFAGTRALATGRASGSSWMRVLALAALGALAAAVVTWAVRTARRRPWR
jgi:FAD/FMN-containing dehydrogenase/Fe-S oxidoreductase